MIKIDRDRQRNTIDRKCNFSLYYGFLPIFKCIDIHFKNFIIKCCDGFEEWFDFDKAIGLYVFGVYEK